MEKIYYMVVCQNALKSIHPSDCEEPIALVTDIQSAAKAVKAYFRTSLFGHAGTRVLHSSIPHNHIH